MTTTYNIYLLNWTGLRIFDYFQSYDNAFYKLLLIKDEIFSIFYYPIKYYPYLNVYINSLNQNGKLETLSMFLIEMEVKVETYYYSADVLFFTETKAIFVINRVDGKKITIIVLDFFDNYISHLKSTFHLNIYGQRILIFQKFSLIFKYKDLLGYQVFNTDGQNGFVLFGYFNSTDPVQIYNLKKDGLNYNITLGNYLNLQSNIFGYEIKYIKIIEVPNITESGLYIVSNVTENILKKDDCIDLNTQISLRFAYNGLLKQGKYLFKFAGVLQETTFEKFENYSDKTIWYIDENITKEEYIEEYNQRRLMNITGRVALVQINVLNDIRVYCDNNFDESALKDENGKYLTCGQGTFYEVENEEKITQKHLGIHYYFDREKNYYIKCHEKCKKCCKLFNSTFMGCTECYENFFLRNGNCLEIAKCEFNYYYDNNSNLYCIEKEKNCPDYKPYEYNSTKECIENCEIYEFNNICNPTNNLISINKTREKIIENKDYLNLTKLLMENKEKYLIKGNNVSFIFSTLEIEKNELYNNYNSSTIIFNELQSENLLRKIYSIPDNIPIPILKIETLNNHSNIIDVYYEFYHPLNLSEKLNLSLYPPTHIEIRIPLAIKQYKMDLILKAKNLGYNIFDLNDSFYHDICSVFTYNESDYSLSERKNLLDLSNETFCNSGCNLSNFDIKTLRAICICNIGENIYYNFSHENQEDSEDDNLFKIITQKADISRTLNLKVIKCFKVIVTKRIFTENYGFYIMLLLNFFNILTLILSPISKAQEQFQQFCDKVIKQMQKVYGFIGKQNEKDLISNDIKESDINNINNVNNYNIKNKKMKNQTITQNEHSIKNKKAIKFVKKIVINQADNLNPSNSDSKDISKSKFDKSLINLNKVNTSNNNANNKLDKIETQNAKIEGEKDDEKIIEELKAKDSNDYYIYNVIKYISFIRRKIYLTEQELMDLSYKYALKIENRNKTKYYFSLLKVKNKIVSMFLNDKDYNIQTVKISLFIFSFNLSMVINALFFNDEAIHQINQDQGSFNLSTQILRILYSAIISAVIGFLVDFLALSHDDIIALRNFKNIEEAQKKVPILIKKLKIKFVSFFCLTIVFNIMFFYYITAFCSIYAIIQTHLISDSLMSFLLEMSYSLVFCLLSSIIKVYSLKKENKLRHFFYLLSWVITLI